MDSDSTLVVVKSTPKRFEHLVNVDSEVKGTMNWTSFMKQTIFRGFSLTHRLFYPLRFGGNFPRIFVSNFRVYSHAAPEMLRLVQPPARK